MREVSSGAAVLHVKLKSESADETQTAGLHPALPQAVQGVRQFVFLMCHVSGLN